MHLWLQEKAFVQTFNDECSHFWCTWVEVEVERGFDKSDRWSHRLQDAILVRILRDRNNQIDTNKIELAETFHLCFQLINFHHLFLKVVQPKRRPWRHPCRDHGTFGSSSLLHFWAIFVPKLIPNTLPRCVKTSKRIHISLTIPREMWSSIVIVQMTFNQDDNNNNIPVLKISWRIVSD